MEDFKMISKVEWLKYMRGVLDANIMKSGNYAKKRREAVAEDDKRMIEFCDYCLLELGRDLNSNKTLLERSFLEDGYNTYAIDEALGVPALISCTADEYRRVYDERGNIRQPSYIR